MDRKSCLLGAAGAVAVMLGAAPARADDVVVKPDWIRKPTQQEMLAYLPGEAAKTGADGRAVIECRVGVDGLLRNCKVLEETPEALGFGPAALAISQLFRMKPGSVNGVPVEGTVRIPLNWKLAEFGKNAQMVGIVSRPVWTAAPTRADLEAVRPEAAAEGGRVVLNCKIKDDGALVDCEREGRVGGNLTKAALLLAGKLRSVPPEKSDAFKETRVVVPFQFDPVGSPPTQDGRLLPKPGWSARPNPEALEFPAAARSAGLKEGKALVECDVQAHGVLNACRIVSETPAGHGFGDAALVAAARFTVNPWTDEGRPVDGSRVRVSLRYEDDAP